MRPFLAIVAALAAVSVAPFDAAADCQPMGSVEEALPEREVAFVGVVTEVDGPVARFTVREVWAGDVAATAEVRGLNDALGGENVGFGAGMSEDDRTWAVGETYLVLPYVDGGVLRDSICSATTPWSDDLERLRPSTARVIDGGTAEGFPVPPAIWALVAMVVVIAAGSILAFRGGTRGRGGIGS